LQLTGGSFCTSSLKTLYPAVTHCCRCCCKLALPATSQFSLGLSFVLNPHQHFWSTNQIKRLLPASAILPACHLATSIRKISLSPFYREEGVDLPISRCFLCPEESRTDNAIRTYRWQHDATIVVASPSHSTKVQLAIKVHIATRSSLAWLCNASWHRV